MELISSNNWTLRSAQIRTRIEYFSTEKDRVSFEAPQPPFQHRVSDHAEDCSKNRLALALLSRENVILKSRIEKIQSKLSERDSALASWREANKKEKLANEKLVSDLESKVMDMTVNCKQMCNITADYNILSSCLDKAKEMQRESSEEFNQVLGTLSSLQETVKSLRESEAGLQLACRESKKREEALQCKLEAASAALTVCAAERQHWDRLQDASQQRLRRMEVTLAAHQSDCADQDREVHSLRRELQDLTARSNLLTTALKQEEATRDELIYRHSLSLEGSTSKPSVSVIHVLDEPVQTEAQTETQCRSPEKRARHQVSSDGLSMTAQSGTDPDKLSTHQAEKTKTDAEPIVFKPSSSSSDAGQPNDATSRPPLAAAVETRRGMSNGAQALLPAVSVSHESISRLPRHPSVAPNKNKSVPQAILSLQSPRPATHHTPVAYRQDNPPTDSSRSARGQCGACGEETFGLMVHCCCCQQSSHASCARKWMASRYPDQQPQDGRYYCSSCTNAMPTNAI